jgi:hypothetical protein
MVILFLDLAATKKTDAKYAPAPTAVNKNVNGQLKRPNRPTQKPLSHSLRLRGFFGGWLGRLSWPLIFLLTALSLRQDPLCDPWDHAIHARASTAVNKNVNGQVKRPNRPAQKPLSPSLRLRGFFGGRLGRLSWPSRFLLTVVRLRQAPSYDPRDHAKHARAQTVVNKNVNGQLKRPNRPTQKPLSPSLRLMGFFGGWLGRLSWPSAFLLTAVRLRQGPIYESSRPCYKCTSPYNCH